MMKYVFMLVFFIFGIALSKTNSKECGFCLETMKGSLETLTMIIETGIFGGCTLGCSKLLPGAVEACIAVCTVVGEEAFVELIKKADLDPVWVCEAFKLCPSGPDCKEEFGCGKFTYMNCYPKEQDIEQPKAIHCDVKFDITQALGISDIKIHVEYPAASEAPDFNDDFLFHEGFPKAGNYSATLQVPAVTREEVTTGEAKITVYLCEGWCESSHAHSMYFDQKSDTIEYK